MGILIGATGFSHLQKRDTLPSSDKWLKMLLLIMPLIE